MVITLVLCIQWMFIRMFIMDVYYVGTLPFIRFRNWLFYCVFTATVKLMNGCYDLESITIALSHLHIYVRSDTSTNHSAYCL